MLNEDGKFTDGGIEFKLFHYLFGDGRCRASALALYNALNESSYEDVAALRVEPVDEAVYLNMDKDASYLVAYQTDLFERRLEPNPNTPLRMMFALSKLFEEEVEINPKFNVVMFFDGGEERPEEETLKLSDAFKDGPGCAELIVHAINVAHGKGATLLEACEPLKEYAQLVADMRGHIAGKLA